jgi:arylsulfatase A-like enzyme
VHYFDPHWPYQPPVGYAVSPHDTVKLKGKRLPKDQNVRDRRHLKELIRSYRGEVAYTDAQIGDLLERLKMLALDERTAVVLTADHGEGLGDHGVMEHGLNLYEELLRVPLIVRAPGIPAGRRLVGSAQLEDLKPTMLALVGVESSAPGDGNNLLPWLEGKTDTSPRSLVVGTRAPNKGKRKLYFVLDGSKKWIGAMGRDGLQVDLALDPREANLEKGEGMPAALSMIVKSAEERSEHVADRRVDPDPEVREALEALGYLDD